MKTIDHKGLGQFASKGLDWQDLSRELLDIALHIKYLSCGPNGFIRKFSKFIPSYKFIGTLCFPLPDEYCMKFHHIWLTDIRDILPSKCEWMMSDARPLPY